MFVNNFSNSCSLLYAPSDVSNSHLQLYYEKEEKEGKKRGIKFDKEEKEEREGKKRGSDRDREKEK